MNATNNKPRKKKKKIHLKTLDPVRRARTETIIKNWAKGLRNAEIIKLQMQEFGIKQRAAYDDFNAAKTEVAKIAMERKDVLIGRSEIQLNEIHEKALSDKNYSAAVQAIRQRDNLLGLADKIEFKGTVEHTGPALMPQVIIQLPAKETDE
jgi:hypothetical protein